MPVINLNINDAVGPRVIEAFAAAYGWTQESGLTKQQFLKSKVIEFIKAVVATQEAQVAAETARTSAIQKAKDEIAVD